MYLMTAAHKTLPLPTYVSVTNLNNGRKIIVRVNDRGPFVGNRIIDLSYTAALELDLVRPGTGPVLVESITPKGVVPTSLPQATYFLSAGVFSDQSNARNLRDNLRKNGIGAAHFRPKQVSGQTMYQVVVGPITSNSEVEKMIEQLTRLLSEKPVLIQQ